MPSEIGKPGGDLPLRSMYLNILVTGRCRGPRAQVINVNIRDFTVDVQYEAYPYSFHHDIPWMTPYLHQNQGEGMAIMPEVGSTVWVCQPSESGRDAFVLGWTPVQESGTYRAGRQLLNPGDIHLSTRDGNFVTIRRGGIVQIGATPVCQRLYIPIRNVIRDFAENYELSTPAGDLTWEVLREEESGDGHQGCLFTLACKEFSDDPNSNPLAILKIGSHGDGNDTILTLETRDSGGGEVKTSLTIAKSGKIEWSSQSDVKITLKGNLDISSDQKTTITSKQDMSFTSVANLIAKASQISLTAGSTAMTLGSGGASISGSSIKLGDGTFPVVIDNGTLGAWIMAVTALLNGLPGSPAMKGILPPVTYKSTKVKA